MTDERQRKREIIEEVLDLMDGGPKPTEADTCSRAIERLLREVSGYGYGDYRVRQQHIGGNQRVYDMLPNNDYTWFVEPKAWRSPLPDEPAGQAVPFPNNNGGRWVVLTNGYEWRLYDNTVQTGLKDKLVLTAKLSSSIDEVLDFLEVISRESMMSGHIVKVVDKIRLKKELDRQLSDSNSVVVKVIVKGLKQIGLSYVTPQMVVEYFTAMREQHLPPNPPAATPETDTPQPNVPPVTQTNQAEASRSLEEWYKHRKLVTGSKPIAIKFPDGSVKNTDNWRSLGLEVIRWLASQNKLPQPSYPRDTTGWFLYNLVTIHANQNTMEQPHKLQLNGGVLYVETNRSASNWVQNLYTLCRDSGEDASQIVITIMPRVNH